MNAVLALASVACHQDPNPAWPPEDTSIESDTATTSDTPGPACASTPCVGELARAVLHGRPEWPGALGYSLAAAGEHVVAGAPFYAYDGADRAVWVSLPDLELVGAWLGDDGFDGTGLAVAAGDVDGDGLPEVAVSRYRAEDAPDGGRVHLLPGAVDDEVSASESALLTMAGDTDVALGYHLQFSDDGAELVLNGVRQTGTEGRILAFSTAARGLVHERDALRTLRSAEWLGPFEMWDGDGDGVKDLVVQDPGGVSLLWGPWTEAVIEDRALAYTDADASTNNTGQVIEDVGDVTGDGRPDLALAAPLHSAEAERAGRAYLLPEAGLGGEIDDIESQLRGSEIGDGMAFAMLGADIDGDGQRDLVASASGVYPGQGPGVVLVYLGPLAPAVRTQADADAAVYGERDSDLFARAMAVVDTDGDGRDDLVLGAPSWPEGRGDGAIYLLEAAALMP